ncbi:hypothetical protein Slin15195_G120250 [Septoria linicola]|uniref:Uncharacterized protein n=1 Tax=Septoria linicola TaxID=215465 RepID=A0A9Q9B9A8_9PEZI|nr:hypothetical protein Slin15195_G120250 [Septoria linicola]
MFFSHHINSPNPYALCPTSLWSSAIIDHKTVSANTLPRLTEKFIHNLAIIPAKQQKQVIDLLFWWEEECSRLRKLNDEEAELTGLVMDSTMPSEQRDMYRQLLLRVRNKKAATPSEREEKLERNEDEMMLRFRAGNMATNTSTEDCGEPPAYTQR